MKRNLLLTVFLSTTAIAGLSSCTATSEPAVVPTDVSAETVSDVASDQQVKVAGSGTAMMVLKALAAEYSAEGESDDIKFLDPSQTSAGITGVKEGQIQLGTVTRAPKEKEQAEGLEHREVARDALLVATNPSVEGVVNLTTEDLKAIYSGEATNWLEFGGPDAEIVLMDRPEDESAKRLLRTHYLGTELANAPNAVVLRNESELIDAVKNTPNSIGAFSLANAISNDIDVNRLTLNGVMPSVETVETQKYPMVRTLGIVWFGAPTPANTGVC